MAIITFEDLTGSCEIVAMGDTFDRYEELLTSDEPLLITGTLRLDRDEDGTRLSVRLRSNRGRGKSTSSEPDVVSLHEVRAMRSEGIGIHLHESGLTEDASQQLLSLLGDPNHAGRCEVRLHVQTNAEHGDAKVTLRIPQRVKPSDDLSHQLRRILGADIEVVTR